jgi:citrate synthase
LLLPFKICNNEVRISSLAAERALPAGVIAQMKTFPPDATPMDVLRTVVSLCGVYAVEKR